MGFGINLGGLWKTKTGTKSVCSGKFNLPASLLLESGRGHKFVVTRRRKTKENEPDFDLWLFPRDDDSYAGTTLANFDEHEPHEALDTANSGDEVPF